MNVVAFCFLQNSEHRIRVKADGHSPPAPLEFESFVIEPEGPKYKNWWE